MKRFTLLLILFNYIMLVALTLFGLIASAFIRRYLIAIVIVLELLLLATVLANISNFIILDEAIAQTLIVLVITIAGAETSCALALIVQYYRELGHIEINNEFKSHASDRTSHSCKTQPQHSLNLIYKC